MSRGVPCLLMRGGSAWRVGARLQPRSRSGCHPNAVRFWMDFSAAALRAALKAVIASVSCRPLVCSTRGARHTPLRTDIKSSIRIIEVYLVHWIPMIRFEQSASKEAEGNHIAFSYFILHTSYFILHTSYFILHKSYLPVTRQQKNKNKNTLRGAGESWRRDEGETSSAANQRDT